MGGEGLVMLRNGDLLGCDNQYFYQGSYELDDDDRRLTAVVKVSHYAGDQPVSIFGTFDSLTLESFQAELEEVYVAGVLRLHGTVTGDPVRKLLVSLMRLLPTAPALSATQVGGVGLSDGPRCRQGL